MADTFQRPSLVERPWQTLLHTGLFCLAIALLLWWLEGFENLDGYLAVSFAIGWSINVSFILFNNAALKVMSPYIAPIPLTAFGLGVGLMLGGTYVAGNPLLFFTENNGTLLVGLFFGVVGIAIFSTRGRLLATQRELAQAQARHERQQKLLMQTELRLLQAQIEPHFLFNTLSNIAGLIHRDPDTAEHTLLHLTTLLRATLNRTRETVTTLEEELAIARAYLEIQRTRMQDRLGFSIECEEGIGSTPLPPLLVQPLVENAIKHGIEPSEDGGEVKVSVTANDDTVTVTVSDTGLGIGQAASGGTGTGLSNVRERLRTLYDGEAGLQLTENQPRGMIATVTLPRAFSPPAL